MECLTVRSTFDIINLTWFLENNCLDLTLFFFLQRHAWMANHRNWPRQCASEVSYIWYDFYWLHMSAMLQLGLCFSRLSQVYLTRAFFAYF